jgi:glycosyltransferase involved in cell wall biosynthesis
MRIIQSCGSASWGGLEITTLETARKMKTRGHEVLLFCTAGSDLEKKSQQAGIKTANVFKKKTWIQMAGSVMRIIPILSSKQYDVIHSHNPHDLWSIVPALVITKRKDIKLTLTIHLASGINKKDPFHRLLYRRVNKIIALSGFLKENILKTYPVERIEITVIPTALSLSEYKPEEHQSRNVKQEFGIRANCLTVGIIGRLTHGKGHEEFVRAAKQVKEKFNREVKFIIAGQPDIGEEEIEVKLRQLCSELDLHNEVVFAGFRSDIPQLLTAIDILAFPSHDEAFGRTIVEAMAMKVPVVASNSSAISEIVVNGKTGILIPPKDSESLANALIGLLRKPELRKRYGEEGRKRVEEKFDADKTFGMIEQTYLATN